MAKFLNSPSQQNYYFKKSVAYTEDHILIKKLFLYNVANEVQAYFEGFGHVLRLELFGGKKQISHSKIGYVHFLNARDAAIALKHNSHAVKGRRLSVQANDSWHQPDAYGCDESYDSPPYILSLNDHCLSQIVRQLTPLDRIRFARSCERFRSAYELSSGALNHSISFEVFDSMTLWDMRDFFMLSGRHLKHIEGIIAPARCQRLCEFFGTHCCNLQTMRVTCSKLTVRNMQKIFRNLDALQELELRSCSLTNGSLLALTHLHQLRKLDLSDNQQLTGHNMNCLPDSLEYLILNNCNGLQSKFLTKLCRSLPKLKELNLKAVYTITTGFQQIVSTKCGAALEDIVISGTPEDKYEYIAKLPNLKKLVIYMYEQSDTLSPYLLTWLVELRAQQLQHFEVGGNNCITATMLSQIGKLTNLRILMLPHNNELGESDLAALQLPQLEQLSLTYWTNVSNQAVLRLILACPKLHVLHLEECPRLTEKLLNDIIFKLRLQLRNKENVRKLPIQMYVSGSKINEFSLEQPDVAAKDIINASLAPPASLDLCLVRMTYQLEFDFFSEEPDSFGSDDEVDRDYDRYMHDDGFLSDDYYECGILIDESYVHNRDNVANMFRARDANRLHPNPH